MTVARSCFPPFPNSWGSQSKKSRPSGSSRFGGVVDRSRKRIGWFDRPGLRQPVVVFVFRRRFVAFFGGFRWSGQPPSNRPLLDNLSVALIDNDWSIKKTIRLIVTSRAYRQSSLVPESHARLDPENKWFGRQARYRLSAEMIRDNALFVSGLLQEGDAFNFSKPYQPEGYYRRT